MKNLDCWYLCEEVSITEAAHLILDIDPRETQHISPSYDFQHPNFEAVYTALRNAALSGSLKAFIPQRDSDRKEPEWSMSRVNVEDLKVWLRGRGFSGGFFFSKTESQWAAYLDKSTPYYAPKLAAAVNAWETVTQNETLLNGRTPKQALEKFLRENASQYGLTKDNGKPNETGITEICKIANWKPEGGAAKTPVGVPANSNPPTSRKQERQKES